MTTHPYDYDLFTIGAGSGGVRASRFAASLYKARVAVAENKYLGGTCVNVGCIPKKLMVYAAHFAEDFNAACSFGWQVGAPTFNWSTLLANKNTEIARLNGIYRDLLTQAGVHIVEGTARLVDAHTVQVGNQTYTAANILIATGGWPVVPTFTGCDHVITSNEFFHLSQLPRRAVIVGGGYIAVEFAGILHGLGVQVTQLYRGELFLRGFDDDVRQFLAEQMRQKNIDLQFNADVAAVHKQASDELLCKLQDGRELITDTVIYATGRAPNTKGLGLEAVGVEQAANGAIKVDERFATTVPNIYAIGDVIDRVQLTPVALAEGMALAHHLFGGTEVQTLDYANIPSTVFSQPSIGSVGLTEAKARASYGAVRVYVSQTRPLKHTLSNNPERALFKVIVDDATDRVVGLHVVGAEAGEIVQGFAAAIKCGMTKAQLDGTIGVHPTLAEELVTMRWPTRK